MTQDEKWIAKNNEIMAFMAERNNNFFTETLKRETPSVKNLTGGVPLIVTYTITVPSVPGSKDRPCQQIHYARVL